MPHKESTQDIVCRCAECIDDRWRLHLFDRPPSLGWARTACGRGPEITRDFREPYRALRLLLETLRLLLETHDASNDSSLETSLNPE